MPNILCQYLGIVSHQKTLEQQLRILEYKIRHPNSKDVLLLLQHPPTYTVGRRRNDVMPKERDAEKIRLKKLDAEYIETERGGLITFHGPGQLIAYPIFNLKNYQPTVKWYVNALERTIINSCQHYNVMTTTNEDTGVWVNNDKIASIGINVNRWITSHGLALNCNIDLSWFSHIVPCGLKDKGVTSLSKIIGRDVTVDDVLNPFIASIEKVFQSSCLQLNSCDDVETNIYKNISS